MFNADNYIIWIGSAISEPSPNLIWNRIWICWLPWVKTTLVRLWLVCTLCTFFVHWALPSLLFHQTALVWVWVIHTVSELKSDLTLFILACTKINYTQILYLFLMCSPCYEVCIESMQHPFDFLMFYLRISGLIKRLRLKRKISSHVKAIRHASML